MNDPIKTYSRFDSVDLELSSLDRRQTITSIYASRLGYVVLLLGFLHLLLTFNCMILSSKLTRLEEKISSREAQQKLALDKFLKGISTPFKDVENEEDHGN